jgi:hypothetical protein
MTERDECETEDGWSRRWRSFSPFRRRLVSKNLRWGARFCRAAAKRGYFELLRIASTEWKLELGDMIYFYALRYG